MCVCLSVPTSKSVFFQIFLFSIILQPIADQLGYKGIYRIVRAFVMVLAKLWLGLKWSKALKQWLKAHKKGLKAKI